MDAFGIFEGGGVRGIALAGALEVAIKEYNYQFIGVAGTSAGAIVAALHSAKWPIDEIQRIVATKNFVDFLDGFGRAQAENGVQEFLELARRLSGGPWDKLVALKRLVFLPNDLRRVITRLVAGYGIYEGDAFVTWLDEQLRLYLKKGRVTFESIETPLKIVASNLNTQEPIVFSKEQWPEMEVAQAVRASMSIPFFFRPFRQGTHAIVDGGLMSNFPAWVFDAERSKIPITIPTMGFRLVEEKTENQIGDLSAFGKAVLSTGLGGYKRLQTRGIENFIEIPIPTKGISFIKFDLSAQEKNSLLDSGRLATREILSRVARPKPARMIVLQLEGACNAIKSVAGSNKHLRANVFLPSGGGKVKIFYQYNMDTDPDREFEFAIDAGVTGRCWQEKKLQLGDLAEVRDLAQADPGYLMRKWKFRPQDQAAVRPTLQSLLSLPIFDPTDYNPSTNTGSLIGVLNFDSDNTIKEIGFNKGEVVEVGKKYAEVIANLLKP